MATNEMEKSKADQALLMRSAARLGTGAKAAEIINATDQKLGNAQNVRDRMLQARNDALKEFGARGALHESQWGKPMEVWGSLMAQGGDLPAIPRSSATDSTGAQQQAMLAAFNQGTRGVSGAFDGLASAAGKSVDLSGVAKALASIKAGGSGKGGRGGDGQESVFVTDNDGNYNTRMSFQDYDPTRSNWGVAGGYGGYGDSTF
jgi:hypothetical protein